MSWNKERIGNCCEITSSKRIFYSEYVPAGVPFYRSKEIIEQSSGKSISEPLFISQEKYEEIKEKFGVPVAGDMLLTSVGTIGVSYIVKMTDHFYFKDGNLTWFRNFSDRLMSPFLKYWLSSSEGLGILNNTTIGSSQKALTITALKNIEMPLPSRHTQQKIVNILSAYDNLIENNQKQIKLLEEAAQRLYKEWFVDLRFPGHEITPVVDGVPEGWKRKKILDVAAINEKSISKDYSFEYVDYIDIGSVSIGRIESKTRYALKDAPGRAKRVVSDGDVIWGMVRPNLKAYALVFHPSDTTIVSTGFAVLSAKEVPFSFLYCHVSQDEFIGYLVNCTNGAAYPAVKPIHFEEAKILIPIKNILGKFHAQVEPMFRKIEVLSKQIETAAEARDRLLPKLMSGEIEV